MSTLQKRGVPPKKAAPRFLVLVFCLLRALGHGYVGSPLLHVAVGVAVQKQLRPDEAGQIPQRFVELASGRVSIGMWICGGQNRFGIPFWDW